MTDPLPPSTLARTSITGIFMNADRVAAPPLSSPRPWPHSSAAASTSSARLSFISTMNVREVKIEQPAVPARTAQSRSRPRRRRQRHQETAAGLRLLPRPEDVGLDGRPLRRRRHHRDVARTASTSARSACASTSTCSAAARASKEGQLNDHLNLQPVITVADDGKTAKGRWRAVLMTGELGKRATIGDGTFENEYVKQNGVWKISKLHWYQTFMVPYEGGWAKNEDTTKGVFASKTLPPDRPPTEQYSIWPDVYVPPFHYHATPPRKADLQHRAPARRTTTRRSQRCRTL